MTFGRWESPSEVAGALGFDVSDSKFRVISSSSALEIATYILHRDLAYSAELMPESEATALAREFLLPFGPLSRFFTNASFVKNEGEGGILLSDYDSITDATFDTGIVVLGSEAAGMLWVEDED
jgi:hypothetical protein